MQQSQSSDYDRFTHHTVFKNTCDNIKHCLQQKNKLFYQILLQTHRQPFYQP